jgi:hypothetical protein
VTSTTTATVRVIGGVDTHGHSHHPAVIDGVGRQLDDRDRHRRPAMPPCWSGCAVTASLIEWVSRAPVPPVPRSLDISARVLALDVADAEAVFAQAVAAGAAIRQPLADIF